MAALPNATFIGFTGTPVSKAAKGQSTFQTFGEPTDPKSSLDSYSTADSVRDGTTLKLNYALAKSEFRLILELNWREIATNPPAEFLQQEEYPQPSVLHIDKLVEQVRSQRFDKIQDQCGILQLLDISRPVAIDDIYIDVNILESIASQQWVEISELQNLDPKEFDRFGLGSADQNQIPGTHVVETHSKLRVLGKPGVGKTTFLQYLAIQCNQSAFAVNQVPIFITLRNFVEESKINNEFSLLKYIRQEFLTSGILDPSVIETLLNAGRVLLLLDGMDEILNQQSNAVLSEIRRFSEKYHKNQLVATCRTASQKFRLQGFTDVEIAPLTSEQIRAFAQKWFVVFTKTNQKDGLAQSVEFIQKLELDENWQFRQSAGNFFLLLSGLSRILHSEENRCQL